ncbi:MAG: hypothetical protein OXU51_23955, partial [Candidatus Poribacteria bacterium]|nr:hypothetical protein [Candidatus Poribacteria bacterium]
DVQSQPKIFKKKKKKNPSHHFFFLKKKYFFFHIEAQHAVTRFIKGFASQTVPKCVPFWNTREKTTLSNPITSRTAWIPQTALTGEGIIGIDITFPPIGTVLA